MSDINMQSKSFLLYLTNRFCRAGRIQEEKGLNDSIHQLNAIWSGEWNQVFIDGKEDRKKLEQLTYWLEISFLENAFALLNNIRCYLKCNSESKMILKWARNAIWRFMFYFICRKYTDKRRFPFSTTWFYYDRYDFNPNERNTKSEAIFQLRLIWKPEPVYVHYNLPIIILYC